LSKTTPLPQQTLTQPQATPSSPGITTIIDQWNCNARVLTKWFPTHHPTRYDVLLISSFYVMTLHNQRNDCLLHLWGYLMTAYCLRGAAPIGLWERNINCLCVWNVTFLTWPHIVTHES
jgi:hypothetical protein